MLIPNGYVRSYEVALYYVVLAVRLYSFLVASGQVSVGQAVTDQRSSEVAAV